MSAVIRTATLADAPRILEIYAPYVQDTAISFEYEVPSLAEFEGRIRNTLQKYPYLVAEVDGMVMGYAYAGPFIRRAAYDLCSEVTIYLAQEAKKCGLGRALYEELEGQLRQMGILNLYACIAYPEQEDEYVNANSVEFHTHMGYRMVGTFHKSGYKFGRWYDMVFMEKIIGEHR